MDFATWMRAFTIRTRMHGAIAMVLTMFAILSLTGYWGARQLMAAKQELARATSEAQQLAGARLALAELRLQEKEAALAPDAPERLRAARERWDSAAERLAAAVQGRQDRMPQLLQDYRAAARPALGQADGASLRELEQQLEGAAAAVAQRAHAAEDGFDAEIDRTAWLCVAVLGVVLIVVVPLTLINSATITSPMRYACTLAHSIAGGDLSCDIRVHGRDEASDLLRALDAMQSSLRGLVSQVKTSALSIETVSGEVAAGNHDLSQRTEQAAASLQQTTNSMEDLTTGVRHGADAAGQARQLAQGAAEVARRGGQEVAEVVSTMDEINASSRRIGDILGLIDSIAFQTNILALNAAVEAARAGEQGRGFAVVASEVRALAQRSAGAAREIKSLITASLERTEAGTRLVQHAGHTMQDIVDNVQKVSDMIGEVATGAADQSQRIVRINGAVTQLDHMTQQNAALVEQSAAAAESLRQQLQVLTGAVAQFRT